MQKLYDILRHITDKGIIGIDMLQYSKKNSIPLLDALGNRMRRTYTKGLPGSNIRKALAYCLNRWDKLSLYETTATIVIDNNPVENSIRPIAIGRKKLSLCRQPCSSTVRSYVL